MPDGVFIMVGALLGLWSTNRLERATAACVQRGSAALLEVLTGLTLRLATVCCVAWLLLASSPTGPIFVLAGYWLARTGYLAGAVVWRRQIL